MTANDRWQEVTPYNHLVKIPSLIKL